MIDSYIPEVRAEEERELERFLSGADTLCFISGAAGSGKTSLVAWVCAGAATIYVKAYEKMGANLVYEACLQILREINSDEEESGIKWRSLLKDVELEFLGRSVNRNNFGLKVSSVTHSPLVFSKNANFFLSVKSLFNIFVKNIGRSVVFVFDDFHWCGKEQQELILDLVESDVFGAKYVLICRDGKLGSDTEAMIDLRVEGRDVKGTKIFLGELSDDSVTRFVDEKIKRKGSGQSSIDHGEMALFRLPYDIIQYMENDILDKLSQEQKYLLFCCSVVGFEISSEIICMVVSACDGEFFNEMTSKGILKIGEEGRCSFAHDITFVRCMGFYGEDVKNSILKRVSSLIENDVDGRLSLGALDRARFLMRGVEAGYIPRSLVALRIVSAGLEDANNQQNIQLMKEIYRAAIGFLKAVKIDEDVCENAKAIAISCYYCNDVASMEEVAELVIRSEVSDRKKIDIYVVLIDGYLSKNLMLKTINATKSALALLGYEMRSENGWFLPIKLAIYHVPKSILGMSLVSKDVSRECESERHQIISQLLTKVCAAYYSTNYMATGQPIADVLWLSARHGVLPETAYAIGQWAFGVGGTLKMIPLGRTAFRLARSIVERHPNDFYRARTEFLYHTFVGVHSENIRENVACLEDVFRLNMRAGSLDIAAYCAHVCAFHALDADFSLVEVKNKIVSFRKNLAGFTQQNASSWMNVVYQLVEDLRAESVANNAIEGPHFSLSRDISQTAYENDRSIVFIANHYAGVWYALVGAYSHAITCFEKASVFRDGVRGTYGEVLMDFYFSISKISLSLKDGIKRNTVKEELHLQWLANSGSKSAQSKFLVVKGYKAVLARKYRDAVGFLDRAIKSARNAGHTLDGILALRAKTWISEEVLGLTWTEDHVELESRLEVWGGRSLITAYRLEDAKPFDQYVAELSRNVGAEAVEKIARKLTAFLGGVEARIHLGILRSDLARTEDQDGQLRFYVAMTDGLWAIVAITLQPGMKHQSSKIIQVRAALDFLAQRTRNGSRLASLANDVVYKKTNAGLIDISLNGDIVRANRRSLELTGNLDQDCNSTITDLFRNFADAREIDEALLRAKNSGWESVILTGKCTEMSLELSVVFDGDDVFNCTVRDVTEKETLRIYKKLVLDRSARLSGLSHEIKNPLLSVEAQLDECVAYATSIHDEILSGELSARIVRCKDSIKTIASEMDDLIAISRVDVEARGNPSEFNIFDLCSTILERWGDLASRHSLKMVLESEDRSKIVFTDKALLAMILRNVVSNAIYHSQASMFRLSIFHCSGLLIIDFSDDGVGMPREIFSSQFITTSPDGSGVGLVNCRLAAKLLGAKLELLESSVGVRIQLQLNVPVRVASPVLGSGSLGNTPYVCIVEDDPRIADLYERWFSRWKIRIYADLEVASQEITKEAFDLVLVDCFIEGKSSEGFIRHLRAVKGWGVPVVGCSANDNYRSLLVRAGATFFVEKTSNKAVLENALLNALAHSSDNEAYRARSLDVVDRQMRKLDDGEISCSHHALAPVIHSLGGVAALYYPALEQDLRYFEEVLADQTSDLVWVVSEVKGLTALLRHAITHC